MKFPILAHFKQTLINFRTEIIPQKFPFEISFNSRILSLGSCFSENIGHYLRDLESPIQINPNGILFNPLSIAKAIEDLLNNNRTDEKDLIHAQGLWHSWKHHGRFSNPDKVTALKGMNLELNNAFEKSSSTKLLIITLGSAFAYLHKSYGIVANCHKVPQAEFKKVLLEQNEIVGHFLDVLQRFKDRSPELEVIFTLSPVRHWKEGPENNSLSKSILRTAIHEIQKKFSFCHYFPSYELMMDDLRDYRWFNSDLLHPNAQAIEYIWEKFKETLFNEDQLAYILEKEKLNRLKGHRSTSEIDHFRQYEEKSQVLKNKFSFLFQE
ncbi:MAG: GSCFA domain-containing protein [Bacteroidota bacterium]